MLFKADTGNDCSYEECYKFLMRFTHLDAGPAWEAFPGQYLDMGITKVNEKRRFLLKVKNK